MLLPVWLALGVAVAAVVASLVFAVVRGLGTWRTFRRFRRHVAGGLADVTRRVAQVEQRMDKASASAARLERAQAELHDSLATARVLSAAFSEVRATVSGVTGIVPRK